jgi:hypothetical protein
MSMTCGTRSGVYIQDASRMARTSARRPAEITSAPGTASIAAVDPAAGKFIDLRRQRMWTTLDAGDPVSSPARALQPAAVRVAHRLSPPAHPMRVVKPCCLARSQRTRIRRLWARAGCRRDAFQPVRPSPWTRAKTRPFDESRCAEPAVTERAHRT